MVSYFYKIDKRLNPYIICEMLFISIYLPFNDNYFTVTKLKIKLNSHNFKVWELIIEPKLYFTKKYKHQKHIKSFLL